MIIMLISIDKKIEVKKNYFFHFFYKNLYRHQQIFFIIIKKIKEYI